MDLFCTGMHSEHQPSKSIRPHSWVLSHSITLSASHDRFVECDIIEYVLMQMEQPK